MINEDTDHLDEEPHKTDWKMDGSVTKELDTLNILANAC